MSYIALNETDKQEMLAAAGATALADLFCCIPQEVRLDRPLDVPPAAAELEVVRRFEALGRKNEAPGLLSFLGGGAYEHFIPAVVDSLSGRTEFVSPYTPYQPEVSQGTLQVIFEFQTLMCQLTGLDIANASLYDGATAAAEAVLMAQRVKNRNRVLVARGLHPQYRETVRTYIRNLGLTADEIPFTGAGTVDMAALSRLSGPDVAAVVVQSPNFFGVCEDVRAVSAAAAGAGALSVVMVAEAVSLGLLEAPGALGADIVAGEAQSLGMPLSFGGPYLGFMASRKDFLRQLPGRVAGQTTDLEGRRGFVLTLSTREQHIRRERATSNICTNQGLCALRAAIFMEALGKAGMRELAGQNAHKARYALEALTAVPGVSRRFSGPPFNEFVLRFPRPWAEVDGALRKRGILGGLGLAADYSELADCALVTVTELRTRADIDRFAAALREVLR